MLRTCFLKLRTKIVVILPDFLRATFRNYSLENAMQPFLIEYFP